MPHRRQYLSRRQFLPRWQVLPHGNPRLPGIPQIRSPGFRNPPSTVPTGFPLAITKRKTTRIPRKSGFPKTRGALSLLPRIFRRHQHLPLGCQLRSPECSTRFSQFLCDLARLLWTMQASPRTLLHYNGSFPSRPTPRSLQQLCAQQRDRTSI